MAVKPRRRNAGSTLEKSQSARQLGSTHTKTASLCKRSSWQLHPHQMPPETCKILRAFCVVHVARGIISRSRPLVCVGAVVGCWGPHQVICVPASSMCCPTPTAHTSRGGSAWKDTAATQKLADHRCAARRKSRQAPLLCNTSSLIVCY